jgi:hypothetical protein
MLMRVFRAEVQQQGYRVALSEEPQEMLEKERCYVTRTAWRALFMKDLYWPYANRRTAPPFMNIDSRHPIYRFPPGGNGERAGLTLTWVSGYRHSHRGETTHH